ncbi:TIGR01777 family oxidoreductase [Marinomonas sp. C2222]|uniref:TIGR01777 family oxidoreductase n=1 Tax=Marinomonas sargassi TaxID=2984494 RepID=A0ABT2YT31_9GAMM|nr:TIGR01777 family oxidoreductase [Marinomonas sargassi]MCV2402779.1 TIGR01777 family oxidoreductase [Marinomonas sargassi]
MKILISGATGFIGRNLLAHMQSDEYEIYALVREHSTLLDKRIIQLDITSLSELNVELDVFINLAGENIASKPWSKKRKQVLYESRVSLTDQIREALKVAPKKVISMSAIGFYGLTKEGEFDEQTPSTRGFCFQLCHNWEKAAERFKDNQTNVVIFRLGVVLGDGGALQKMRLPFLMGLGGQIAEGDQWFSWIHIEDVIRAILDSIKTDSLTGTYNLVAPQYITQKDFATTYAKVLGRPAALKTPRFLLKLLFGEMAQLLTEGPKVSSKKLEGAGFDFTFTTLESALIDIEKSA